MFVVFGLLVCYVYVVGWYDSACVCPLMGEGAFDGSVVVRVADRASMMCVCGVFRSENISQVIYLTVLHIA